MRSYEKEAFGLWFGMLCCNVFLSQLFLLPLRFRSALTP